MELQKFLKLSSLQALLMLHHRQQKIYLCQKQLQKLQMCQEFLGPNEHLSIVFQEQDTKTQNLALEDCSPSCQL
jgi:hypothetical protein